MDETSLPLYQRLHLETARITWEELARFFARGRVIEVKQDLDLIAVAEAMVKDNTVAFQAWTEQAHIRHLPDEVAKQWAKDDSHLWAVVVAPWVLVQEREALSS